MLYIRRCKGKIKSIVYHLTQEFHQPMNIPVLSSHDMRTMPVPPGEYDMTAVQYSCLIIIIGDIHIVEFYLINIGLKSKKS